MATEQPLWRLAQRGDSAGLAAALDSGGRAADIDADDGTEGVTALCHAAAQGHEDVVRLLLRYGASLEVADARGQTPLLWAVTQGHEHVAQLLLRHGAKPEAATTAGNTAFHLACKVVCKNVFNPKGMALIKAIVDAGVDTSKQNSNGFTGTEFLAGAGAHGVQWLAQLQRLLQPAETSAAATATIDATPSDVRGAGLPWIAELEGIIADPPARDRSFGEAESVSRATAQCDTPINALLSYRTDELSTFASKLRRALQSVGIHVTVAAENCDPMTTTPGVNGRTVLGWVQGIGELLCSIKATAAAPSKNVAAVSDVDRIGSGPPWPASTSEHHVAIARAETTIRRVWSGLEQSALLRVLNCAARQAAASRSRTNATMVADAAATELLVRQLNHSGIEGDVSSTSSELGITTCLALRLRKMFAGVSEVALLDHVGPCITAAEQRLSTSGVQGDSETEAVQVAGEMLVQSLDARDAERAVVRKRWREMQVLTIPVSPAIPFPAEQAAAVAAIGGVGGTAATEHSTRPTAEELRETRQLQKQQELQHAQYVSPMEVAAVSLQAATRGWLVRSCGGKAPMPFDWHMYSAVCSADAVVAVISRTFAMGDAAQCAA